jgi:hypothetical protein
MHPRSFLPSVLFLGVLTVTVAAPPKAPKPKPLNVKPPPISTDKSIKYDYDIVYVRAPRAGDKVAKRFYTEIAGPAFMMPGADLMLLHPDGSEEVLFKGGKGSVTDPFVSFDAAWVYFAYFHDLTHIDMWTPHRGGADIYKLHLKSRKLVRLTHQEITPNTGSANWASDFRTPQKGKQVYPYGTLNLGPCPLPGGKIIFTSSRDGFLPPKHHSPTLQLFVMDDDGSNVECVGHLNIGMALHPVVLKDGRVMFSSLESQAQRNNILWGLWTIHPDGTNWAPLVSAFDIGWAPNAFHFQSQLSDGSIIAELYYNQNNSGFGTFFKLPPRGPSGYPQFAPANTDGPLDPKMHWLDGGYRLPFRPRGMEVLTRFAHGFDGPAGLSVKGDKKSPHVGKVTHPSGAPDNHLLCVWSPGPVNHQYRYLPMYDGGIYLLKNGQPVDEPGQLRLIKNDPRYNEQFPRAVVPYKRIYGIDEPKRLQPLANDGKRSPHLPEGTPFGLVGTSSLYKRESYPNGVVPRGKVTAAYVGGHDPWRGLDPFTSHGNGPSRNWNNQGSDVGLYSNDQIHAVRILAMEPTSHHTRGHFYNHARERLRILGEIPVRKFKNGKQPLDPDGNPDTSFLAKIPANTAFTFQTLDKDGLMLNMAQTWHQLRPSEIRNNCGGCHAHSQKPTPFAKTAAARREYQVFNLTGKTPLLTGKSKDQSGKKWDLKDTTGLRYVKGVVNVEYHRDIRPILQRSCVACHTKKWAKPAGHLVLDADDETLNEPKVGKFPGTYYRLAVDNGGKFSYPSVFGHGYGVNNASRYIRKFQARRSLLVWKILGRRSDGFSNDDHPTETVPGDPKTLKYRGRPIPNNYHNRARADLDYTGSPMPPPQAVAGKYTGPDGKKIKVPPLTDEDRRTIFRWIDLGCPIDLDYDPKHPERRGQGWMLDDKRPTLTLTYPRVGVNPPLGRIRVGMYDYYTGLDMKSFMVVADFAVEGVAAGKDLAPNFRRVARGVWELRLAQPVKKLERGKLIVSVTDRQGNLTRIERKFSVTPRP